MSISINWPTVIRFPSNVPGIAFNILHGFIFFIQRAILWDGAIIIPVLQVGKLSHKQATQLGIRHHTQTASPRACVLNYIYTSFKSRGRICGSRQLPYIAFSSESHSGAPHRLPIQGDTSLWFSQPSQIWPIPSSPFSFPVSLIWCLPF